VTRQTLSATAHSPAPAELPLQIDELVGIALHIDLRETAIAVCEEEGRRQRVTLPDEQRRHTIGLCQCHARLGGSLAGDMIQASVVSL
jgi:hypothetical protein